MFISEKYKEGIIYQKDGTVLVRLQCKVTASDENIYETLKVIAPIVDSQEKLFRINTVFKNILDQAPETEKPSTGDTVRTEDTVLTIPPQTYILNNMIFTDEDIYGDNLDGVNRRYRIIWKDSDGVEYFVPLENFDTFEAKNPHGQFAYDSETKQLIFSATRPYSTDYILRRYYYNE